MGIFGHSKFWPSFSLFSLFFPVIRLWGIGDRSTSVTENYDQSDNRNIGAQENVYFAEGLSTTFNVTDQGAVASAVDALKTGFTQLVGGFTSLVGAQSTGFEHTLGYAKNVSQDQALLAQNVSTGESFSTLAQSKNMIWGAVALAIGYVVFSRKK